MHWKKGNIPPDFQRLPDSKLTLIPGIPKCPSGPLVKIRAYACQVINAVLVQGYIIDPVNLRDLVIFISGS